MFISGKLIVYLKRHSGAELHPEAADSLFRYVAKHEHESEIMERTVTSAVWLLQRA